MNNDKTELETTPSETGAKERVRPKDRPGPGKPSEPPPSAPPSEPPGGGPHDGLNGGSDDQPTPRRRGGGFLTFLSLLFSLAALALAGWMWWQAQAAQNVVEAEAMAEIARLEASDSELSLKISQVRDEIDRLASGDVSAEFEAMQRRMRTDREKMSELEQAMNDQLALSRSLQAAAESAQGRLRAAEAAVSNMSTRELDAGGELDLAEVDYLLRLANERLKLFSDPEAADQALEVADLHLAALDNPMYLGVRQDIAEARRALDALELPDYLAISRRLDSIQAVIPALTFVEDQAPLEQIASEDENGWWAKTKSALSSLVTVRRSAEGDSQRLSLDDKDYVRQRMWLQLEIAHLALMRRDQRAFREALVRVEETLQTWFDASTDAFEQVASGIDELRATVVETDMPDISKPWSTLRTLQNVGRSATPAAPAGTGNERDEARPDRGEESDDAIQEEDGAAAEEPAEAGETQG